MEPRCKCGHGQSKHRTLGRCDECDCHGFQVEVENKLLPVEQCGGDNPMCVCGHQSGRHERGHPVTKTRFCMSCPCKEFTVAPYARAQQDPDPDLISRAREFASKNYAPAFVNEELNHDTIERRAEMMASFAREVAANDAWVPVEERLPTFDSDVLITYLSEPTKAPLVGEGFFNTYEQRWHHRNSGWTPDVIAWMPLPPPYSGKGGKE